MPSVRRLLSEYKISSKEIKATGPRGHILKGDVLSFLSKRDQLRAPSPPTPTTPLTTTPSTTSPSSVPRQPIAQAPIETSKFPPSSLPVELNQLKTAPSSNHSVQTYPTRVKYTDTETSTMRKVIAQRLTQSKTQIPHVYVTEEIDIDKLLAYKKQLAAVDIKLSVNDFIIKAAALALSKVPQVNTSWDSQRGESIVHKTIDVAVAVALDSGLITPVIRDANTKSLQKISEEMKDLAERARTNKLKPHEYQGGSFSISNLGMFGITEFAAVINPPQGCIMAIGGIKQRVTFDENTKKFTSRSTLTVTLSYDGRAISDHDMALWLEHFSHYLSDPQIMGV